MESSSFIDIYETNDGIRQSNRNTIAKRIAIFIFIAIFISFTILYTSITATDKNVDNVSNLMAVRSDWNGDTANELVEENSDSKQKSNNDDDYVQEYEYTYKHKSISYDKDLTDSPTKIYTNHKGNVVIVGDSQGTIMRSTNYGKAWHTSTLTDGSDTYSIAGLVMNEKGNEMLVSTKSDLIFYSDDYGETFSKRSSSRQCSLMASSVDLKTIACIGGEIVSTSSGDDDDDGEDDVNYNHLYYSQDSGYTWTKSDSKYARWVGIVSNQDGTWIVGVIKHKMKYVWASSDGGATYSCINDEEINDWGCLCASKDLQTMMLTDTVSRNVHISMDYGYTWTQIYDGEDQDSSVTVNSCAVSANSYEGSDTNIALAVGFTGTSMKVVFKCSPHTELAHCADRWIDTGDDDTDADTFSVALSQDGKYFYAVDSNTMKISIGHRESI